MAEMTDLNFSSNTQKKDIEGGSNDMKNVFFDTIGVQFHFRTFLFQWIAHLLLPLFPCMINWEGQIASVLFTWITPCLSYLMIISYLLADGEHTAGMEGAFLIPLIYYLQHRLVIAIKYGSLSQTEYKKFMNCRDKELAVFYREQMQLGQGWQAYNSEVVHFELAAASARIGARINDITICIANPDNSIGALNQLRAWNAFLRGHDVIDYNSVPCKQLVRMPDGNYRLSVYDLCEGLVLKAWKFGNERSPVAQWSIQIFNTANLVLPLILIFCYFDPSYDPVKIFWMMVFYISSTVINYAYAQTFYGLLYIAIVDVYRQLSMMRDLNCMMRLTDLMVHSELTVHRGISEVEEERTERRVAEIISIRSAGAHVPVQYEDPDDDQPDVFAPAAPAAANSKQRNGQDHHSTESTYTADIEQGSGCGGDAISNRARAKSEGCVIGERIYRDNEAHWLPRINFDASHNIVAWTHARLVIQNFGERFHFRLELYVVCAMAMVLVMMLVGLLDLGFSHDRLKTFLMPYFLMTLLSVTMCVAFLVVIMQTGAAVNDSMENHSQTMCAHALRLNRKAEALRVMLLTERDPALRKSMTEKMERLTFVAEKMEAMRDVIETNTQIKPFKVFGFTAQSSLTMSILTTAFSFFAVLVSFLSNSEGAAVSLLSQGV